MDKLWSKLKSDGNQNFCYSTTRLLVGYTTIMYPKLFNHFAELRIMVSNEIACQFFSPLDLTLIALTKPIILMKL